MDDKLTIEQVIDLFTTKLTTANNQLEEFKARAFKYEQLYNEEKKASNHYRSAYYDVVSLDDNKTKLYDDSGELVGILFGKGPNLYDILEAYRERDELRKEIKELRKAFS